MNILHLTDFHIDSPKSASEALRDAYFPEYLETLINQIKPLNIQYIFITGDIVNRAKVANFSSADKVISYLASKLCIPLSGIFIVSGNHDSELATRSCVPFNDFSQKYSSPKPILIGKRCKVFKQENNNFIICLDSTGINTKNGEPTPLDEGEIDEIVSYMREEKSDNIFVLSHHPAASYEMQGNAPFDEDSHWNANHIWASGGHLFRRLSNATVSSGKVFWFAGDVHRPEYTIIDGKQHLVVTGGCNAHTSQTSAISPQAVVVDLINSTEAVLLEYAFTGHNRKGLVGEWKSKKKSASTMNLPSSKENNYRNSNIDKVALVPQKIALKETELEPKLGKQIFDFVTDNKLYKFGRFQTCSEITTLAWVGVTSLLSDRSIYSKIVNQFKSKIDSKSKSQAQKDKTIIIGLDSWGAILAARIGAATNIRSCTVASKGQSESYDGRELINDALKKIIDKKNNIFVISDVISTGNTLIRLHQQLSNDNQSWHSLSVICDPIQQKSNYLDYYKSSSYCCGLLRMPLLDTSLLPSNPLLKPDISFI